MKKPTDVLRSRLKKAIVAFEVKRQAVINELNAALEELPFDETVDEVAATPVAHDSPVLLFEVARSEAPEAPDKPSTIVEGGQLADVFAVLANAFGGIDIDHIVLADGTIIKRLIINP